LLISETALRSAVGNLHGKVALSIPLIGPAHWSRSLVPLIGPAQFGAWDHGTNGLRLRLRSPRG
jgi:hypothetical protein